MRPSPPRRALRAALPPLLAALLLGLALPEAAATSSIHSLPQAMLDHAAVATRHEVLVFGGHGTHDVLDTIVAYNLTTHAVTTKAAKLPWKLQRSVAFWDPTPTTACPAGCAYVLGGHNDHDPHPDGAPWTRYDKVLRYEPVAGTLATMAWTLPMRLSESTAVWDPRPLPAIGCAQGCAYLFGGVTEAPGIPSGIRAVPIDDVYRIEPKSGTITLVADMPSVRFDAAAFFDGTHAFVTGGHRTDHNVGTNLTPVLRFDPVTSAIAVVGPDLKVADHVVWWTGHHAYIYGGGHGIDHFDARIHRFNTSTWQRDVMLEWMGNPRVGHAAFWLGNDTVILGGLSDTTLFDRIQHHAFRPGPPGMSLQVPEAGGRVDVTFGYPDDRTYDAPIQGYHLFRGASTGSSFSLVATVPVGASWTDLNVTPGWSYAYKARAFNAQQAGFNSTAQSVTLPTEPDPPWSSSVARGKDLGQLDLGWPAPPWNGGRPITSYTVYRSSASEPLAPVGTVPASVRAFNDSGLAPSTTYAYRITSTNAVGESVLSDPVSATTAADVPPGAPGGLAVAPVAPATLRVSWTASTTGDGPSLWSYHVLRAPAGGEPARVATVLAGTLSFTDTDLAGGETYDYAVEAESSAGVGPRSGLATATAALAPDAPAAPHVAAGPGAGDVTFSWAPPASDGGDAVTAWHLARAWDRTWADDDGSWETRVFQNDAYGDMHKRFTLGAAEAANAVWARVDVFAQRGACDSAPFAIWWNSQRIWNVTNCQFFPVEPGWVSLDVPVARLQAGTNSIWFAGTGFSGGPPIYAPRAYFFVDREHDVGRSDIDTFNASGFVVYPGELLVRLRVAYAQTTTVDGALTSLVTSGHSPGAAHGFQVSAQNRAGIGPASALASGTSPERPSPPTLAPLARGPAAGQVSLAWLPPARDGGAPLTAYAVYRIAHHPTTGAADPGAATRIALLPATADAHVDSGLDAGRLYTYFVRAANVAGEGDRSARLSVAAPTAPDAPAFTSALSGPADDEATLAWLAPANDGGVAITGYEVRRDGALIATVAGTATTYVDAGRAPGAQHAYDLRAVNGVGVGAAATRALTMWEPPAAPAAPASERATDAMALRLAWSMPASDGGAPVTAYDVWRGASGGPLALLATVAGTSYHDGDVAPATAYTYAVAARNRLGAGPLSPVASLGTLHAPPDCGTQLDADDEGLSLPPEGACAGHLAPGDARDVLLVSVPAGRRIDLVASGPVVRLEGPDGTIRPVIDGEGHAYAVANGTWRIVVEATAPGGTTPYSLTVSHAPAPL
ncbi:MAG TPA: fibronectin type III domain-containing protein, partial [Candidatus Thermoplasmatota archaeon]|nr:fibronectin type III domain-containing protein [Candidatus Thermoplasmatota archaeon]